MSIIVRRRSLKERMHRILDHLPPTFRQWLLAVGVAAIKNEKLIESLKLLKLIKVSGSFAAGLSVLVSIGFYSSEKGTAFALAFIVALLIHEVGHIIAMWRKGLGDFWELFSSMRAIPFVGAFIQAPDWANREDEAYIGFGGPLFSMIGGVILLFLYEITPAREISGLNKVFLALGIILILSAFYNVVELREMPIKDFRQTSWGAVMEQFFLIPLVRKICTKMVFAAIALLIWRYATDMPIESSILVYMTAFLSMAFASLNLIITIRPLDGGRILQIVGSLFRYIGIAVLIGLSIYLKESSIFLLWMIVLVGVRMNPVLRFYSVCAMGFIMVTSMVIGHTSQTEMENVADIGLGIWMIAIAYARRKERWHIADGHGDRRSAHRGRHDRRKERALWRVRIKWLALYCILLFTVYKLGEAMIRVIPPHFKL